MACSAAVEPSGAAEHPTMKQQPCRAAPAVGNRTGLSAKAGTPKHSSRQSLSPWNGDCAEIHCKENWFY